MKILQVHNFYKTPGGECSVVGAERRLLESHGHEVIQFVRDSKDIDNYSLINKGLSFVQIPYNVQTSRALSSFLQKNTPDIAHVHNVFPLMSPSVYVTLKRHHIPVVQTIHNYRFLCPNGLFFTHDRICEECLHHGFISAVKNRCMHNSLTVSMLYASAVGFAWKSHNIPSNIDRYIALNQFVAGKLIAGGVPGEKIRICGNFVEKTADSPLAKKNYILYLGRLSAEKGLWTLLKASQKVPAVKLKLAGRGPLETELREYVRGNHYTNIEFTGFVSGGEKERLIGEAICTVVPSEWYENFPISVLESLALGTPVIASRIGGLPEMVDHGQTGMLFTPGDADELAACISMLAYDKNNASDMAKKAIHIAKSCFGQETHYNKLLEIYRELLTQHNLTDIKR